MTAAEYEAFTQSDANRCFRFIDRVWANAGYRQVQEEEFRPAGETAQPRPELVIRTRPTRYVYDDEALVHPAESESDGEDEWLWPRTETKVDPEEHSETGPTPCSTPPREDIGDTPPTLERATRVMSMLGDGMGQLMNPFDPI